MSCNRSNKLNRHINWFSVSTNTNTKAKDSTPSSCKYTNLRTQQGYLHCTAQKMHSLTWRYWEAVPVPMQTQGQKNAQSHLEVLGSWRVREMTVDRKVHVWGVVAVLRVAGCKMALVIIWLIAHSVHFVGLEFSVSWLQFIHEFPMLSILSISMCLFHCPSIHSRAAKFDVFTIDNRVQNNRKNLFRNSFPNFLTKSSCHTWTHIKHSLTPVWKLQ